MNSNYLCLIFGTLWIFVAPSSAINCFKCKSSDNANCTHIHPSGVAVPAANCDNPDELVKDWIRGYLKTIKLGDFAEIDLKKLFNFTTNTVDDKAELKDIPACAYVVTSTQNEYTESIDQSISKVKTFFGDKNADDPVTVRWWVMRDCVMVHYQESAREVANKCVAVPQLRKVAKMYVCTCTEDKCNGPNARVQNMIEEVHKAEHSGGTPACAVKSLSLINLIGVGVALAASRFKL